MVVGASGFIGSAIIAHLLRGGHEVVSVSRSHPPAAVREHFQIDLSSTTSFRDWTAALDRVEAVVNCAGVFRDGPRDSLLGVHVRGVNALYEACERGGVRRVVHISAAGVDRETPSAFSRSKRQGEEALMARTLDWVILRPGIVFGHPAYGGSALMRGLAALPVFPVFPGTGPLQLVHLDDLVNTVAFFLHRHAPLRVAFDVVGPRRWHFEEVVAACDDGCAGRPR